MDYYVKLLPVPSSFEQFLPLYTVAIDCNCHQYRMSGQDICI